MKICFFIFIICISILATFNSLSASPITVPVEHWSYDFIERLQAKGILRDYLSNTKPYTRDEMAGMIFYTSEMLEKGGINLSKIQKAHLEELKKEFAQELKELGDGEAEEYRRLLNWSDGKMNFVAGVGIVQDATLKSGDEDYRISNTTLELDFYGKIKEGFYIASNSDYSYEESNEPRPIWQPFTYRYPYRATTNAYLVFALPWIDLQIGKDQIQWGPGYHGSVGLSAVEPSFDFVKLPFEIWKIKFTSIVGFLRDNIKNEDGSLIRKNLSAHRVEIKPYSGICVAWQEAYVYARDTQLAMVNPIMPYQMAEDYFADLGNNTMEGDVDVCLIPNTRVYLSLFLDDYHPNSNLFKRAGFRWAILGGIFIVDPLGFEDFDIRAEYARVEPWTYAHKGTVQKYPIPTSYKHFDTPLGHWIGPNADDILLEASYYLTKDLQTTASYNRIREGEMGGNIYEYDHDILEYGEKEFLGGVVESKHKFNIGLEYRIFQDSTIKLDYSYVKINNKQTEEAKLPNMARYKNPIWIVGNDWSQNIIKASLHLRY